MPADAPRPKRERTAAMGAEVVLYDRAREDRQAIAHDIAERRNAALVPPYDDPLVIAGQGTAGREMVEDLAAQGLVPDVIAVTASGGGLTAGIALAVKERLPLARLYTAEPEGIRRSRALVQERAQRKKRGADRHHLRCAHGANSGRAHLRDQSHAGWRGRGGERSRGCCGGCLAFHELKLVLEPGGAVALAAILSARSTSRARLRSPCYPAAMSIPSCSIGW